MENSWFVELQIKLFLVSVQACILQQLYSSKAQIQCVYKQS
jgi:hypothetical protein